MKKIQNGQLVDMTAEEEGAFLAEQAVNNSIDVHRALVWERIKAHRETLSDLGGYKVVVGGVDKWFHSDAKSKTQQLSLVIAGAAVPAIQWKTMDGTFVTMSQALAGAIFQAAAAQDAAIFTKAEQHKAAMEAAPDPLAYDFSGGWPATFGS